MSRPVKARLVAAEPGEQMQRVMPFLLLLSILAIGLSLGGCNTMRGAGQDMNAAGKAVTNSAEQTKSGT